MLHKMAVFAVHGHEIPGFCKGVDELELLFSRMSRNMHFRQGLVYYDYSLAEKIVYNP